jgi:uncharacterized protein YqjF (DUF2071 family)
MALRFPFLNAWWSNLFLVTYPVPPSLLAPRLPLGLELDNQDGQAFVSLVAFDFLRTRVFGLPWPGYRNFAELNLRFYVRQGAERGVMFLREIVSLRLVAWVARVFYNEPYRVAPLRSMVRETPAHLTVEHRLQWAGRTHVIEAVGRKPGHRPADSSVEHFFKEHRWGYGVTRRGRATRYEVIHPVWEVYPVERYRVDLDWGLVYGPEWEFLQRTPPCSVILAAGSPVRVYSKGQVGAAAVRPAAVTPVPVSLA